MGNTSDTLIKGMVEAIVREVRPHRIYLFGSRASGSYTADSDVDLLIVEDESFDPARNLLRMADKVA